MVLDRAGWCCTGFCADPGSYQHQTGEESGMNDKSGYIDQNTYDCIEVVGGFIENGYGAGTAVGEG